MKHRPFNYLVLFSIALFAAACLTACEDDESSLGISLVDPATLYNGHTATLYPGAAWSATEDSLLTNNYSFAIIGRLTDAVFGKTSATLFTQVALPTETRYLDFDSVVIDSVVLSLVKHQLHPDTSATYRMHIEIKQLAEPVESDKKYYATDELPVDESTLFFDDYVNISYSDSIVRLMLDRSVLPHLTQADSAANFATHFKGLRIRVAEGSDNGMMSIDLSTTATCITVYYHYNFDGEDRSGTYDFLIGGGAAHFNQYTHDYSGTIFAASDSIGGTNRLYMEPLGGHCIHIDFDTAIRSFHSQHPTAVVHHAELRLPLAETPTMLPDRILAYKKVTSDSLGYINDMLDIYNIASYDGTYNADQGYYRLRVTQHLQGMLRQGFDPGMQLLLYSRRHTTSHAIINGTADTTLSPKIVFVYSE
ncbi:MAG: DUF4270 family protein [Bacteroidales bacterium]|nr:DUF4270 family protein [Bacteroidales bacterium]